MRVGTRIQIGTYGLAHRTPEILAQPLLIHREEQNKLLKE